MKIDGELPVWDGELYLELHRGTYTSQSKTKKLHKEAEDSLYLAELISAFTDKDFSDEIDELWKILLRNEFHDILPGSSIKEVYEDTEKELRQVIEKSKGIIVESLKVLSSENEEVLTLLNVSSFPKKCLFFLNEDLEIFLEGEALLKQKTHDGRYVYFIDREIPPFTKVELKVRKATSEETPNELREANIMENEFLRVYVNDDGTVQIYDKELDRYVFEEKGNVLKLHKNIPTYWDNWDIAENVEKTGYTLSAKNIEK